MQYPRSSALYYAVVTFAFSLALVAHQEFTVNQGNVIHVYLDHDVSSKTARVGDKVVTHCQGPDCGGFPINTKFYAVVQEAAPADNKKAGYIRGKFVTAVLPDNTHVQIEAQALAPPAQGTTSTKKSTRGRNAVIGGAIGGLAGGDFLGAAVGAGIGAAVGKDKKTETTDITIKAGTAFDIRMLKTVTVKHPSAKKG